MVVAGLFSWFLLKLLADSGNSCRGASGPTWLQLRFLGILIVSFAVGFADHWSGNTVIYRWVALGALFGLLAGLSGGVLAGVLTKLIGPTAGFRMISWAIVGLFIGAGIGVRSWDVNRARLLYSLLGGVAGGALGGAVFMSLGGLLPEYNEAIGYVLLGIGICFGVTYAPILIRRAVLAYVSSDDPKVRNTLGKRRKEWPLLDGDKYVSRQYSSHSPRVRVSFRKSRFMFLTRWSQGSTRRCILVRASIILRCHFSG